MMLAVVVALDRRVFARLRLISNAAAAVRMTTPATAARTGVVLPPGRAMGRPDAEAVAATAATAARARSSIWPLAGFGSRASARLAAAPTS